MAKAIILNETDLRRRIQELDILKDQQEQDLRTSIRDLYQAVNPVSMIKDTLSKLAEDPEVQEDVTRIGLRLGTDYLIGKFMGKNNSIRKYISAMMVEKVANYLLQNHSDKIFSGIQGLVGFIKKTVSSMKGKDADE